MLYDALLYVVFMTERIFLKIWLRESTVRYRVRATEIYNN